MLFSKAPISISSLNIVDGHKEKTVSPHLIVESFFVVRVVCSLLEQNEKSYIFIFELFCKYAIIVWADKKIVYIL